MKANEEGFKGMGFTCCGPLASHDHTGSRLTIGTILILVGFIWFGASMEWIDLTWIRRVPFWPVIVIVIGVSMVYRGFETKKERGLESRKRGDADFNSTI
jgi:hypothetical protein